MKDDNNGLLPTTQVAPLSRPSGVPASAPVKAPASSLPASSAPGSSPASSVTSFVDVETQMRMSAPGGDLSPGMHASGVNASGMGASGVDLAESVDMGETTVPPPPAREDPYVGKTIDGRYFVERVLGEGGMGIVYKGRHRVIDKRVAIKVLRGDLAKDKEITERFLQEARAASSIGNAHIIDISDFGQLPDGSTYFVMEFLDGESLASAFERQRPMPIARLTHIAKQIAQGLSAAHGQGIVHRDLKPDNVMLVDRGSDKDFVKILDFGIAKVGGEASRLTRAGSVFGTPHYMSPEQAAGAAVDHRTDIYALGVILYEMTSGHVPFDADNFMGILTQHMYKAPVPIRALLSSSVNPNDIPPGLDAIVLKCLSKKPEARYGTMDELIADFEKLEKGLMPDAVPEMMSRSGGFNVPADYFRARGMPTPVPATPAGLPRARWGLYAGLAGIATAVVIVVLILARSATTTASSQPPTMTAASTPGPSPVLVTNAASATAAPIDSAPAIELPATKQVLLSVEPSDAKVTRDGKDLGSLPIAIDVTEGQKATLVITRSGFKSQTLVLDGVQAKKLVRLTKDAGPSRPQAAPRAPQGQAPSLSGDFQDPFLKK